MLYQALFTLLLVLSTKATPIDINKRQDSSLAPTVAHIANEYGHRSGNCATPTDVAQSWLCEHPEIQTGANPDPAAATANYGTVNPATVVPQPTQSVPDAPASATDVVSSQRTDVGIDSAAVPTRTNGVVPTQPLPSVPGISNTQASGDPATTTAADTGSTPAEPPSVIEGGFTITKSDVPAGPDRPASTTSPVDPAIPTTSVDPGAASESTTAPSSGVSSSASAGAPTTGGNSSAASGTGEGDCKCGYSFSEKFNSAYYPLSKVIDFSKIPDGSSIAEALGSEFVVSEGDQIGAISKADGVTFCTGSSENVYIKDGLLNIRVSPGGGEFKGGELVFNVPTTGGIFSMDAKIDKKPGTCQSLFTYRKTPGTEDEIDMEMLGAQIHQQVNGEQGIGLSNYESDGAKKGKYAPYPTDPTADFNRYTIGWYDKTNGFYYNDEALEGPELHLPTMPSTIIINNWANGDPGFTGAAPEQENVLQIRKLEYYYQTGPREIYPALIEGCTVESACQVK
ncbi:uncharacterized protein L201_006702 [Kwoniella dendrophila CBS 6074]|uniref:GH16 domain-containing protein n=1 Tax=Kwoniella dendrophila CBS 6074 TaxID=1295534 RepID=A0AAX4K4Q9_9TREE